MFEIECLLAVSKTDTRLQSPGRELCSVGTVVCVVIHQSLSQIFGEASVKMSWGGHAFENIDVVELWTLIHTLRHRLVDFGAGVPSRSS